MPIEPDGSVSFRVPADTPVYFQILDENHMELRRMRSFISFQPGESRGCVGCHETREEAAAVPAVPMALAKEPLSPIPPPWVARAISFLRDVQPVFDKHCVACHGGLKPAAGLDFSGGLSLRQNRAYDTILADHLIAQSNVGDDARITQPLEFGSHKSKLVEVLRNGRCAKRAKLTDEDWYRLVTWIDANGPYHDGFINKRLPQPPYDLAADTALAGKLAGLHAKRCAGCHQPGEITRLDWIDLAGRANAISRRSAGNLAAWGASANGPSTKTRRMPTIGPPGSLWRTRCARHGVGRAEISKRSDRQSVWAVARRSDRNLGVRHFNAALISQCIPMPIEAH